MKFTSEQIANWRDYESVRLSGRWNMFTSNARIAAGLSLADYSFCMKHYSELKEAAEKVPE